MTCCSNQEYKSRWVARAKRLAHKVSRWTWISWTKAHLLQILIVRPHIRFQLIHRFPITQSQQLSLLDTMAIPASDIQNEIAYAMDTLQKLYPDTFDTKKYLYLPHGKYAFAAEYTFQGRSRKEIRGCFWQLPCLSWNLGFNQGFHSAHEHYTVHARAGVIAGHKVTCLWKTHVSCRLQLMAKANNSTVGMYPKHGESSSKRYCAFTPQSRVNNS